MKRRQYHHGKGRLLLIHNRHRLSPLMMPAMRILRGTQQTLFKLQKRIARNPLIVRPSIMTGRTRIGRMIRILTANSGQIRNRANGNTNVRNRRTTTRMIKAQSTNAQGHLFRPTVRLSTLNPPTVASTHLIHENRQQSVTVMRMTTFSRSQRTLTHLLPRDVHYALRGINISSNLIIVRGSGHVIPRRHHTNGTRIASNAMTSRTRTLTQALKHGLHRAVNGAQYLDVDSGNSLRHEVHISSIIRTRQRINYNEGQTGRRRSGA